MIERHGVLLVTRMAHRTPTLFHFTAAQGHYMHRYFVLRKQHCSIVVEPIGHVEGHILVIASVL